MQINPVDGGMLPGIAARHPQSPRVGTSATDIRVSQPASAGSAAQLLAVRVEVLKDLANGAFLVRIGGQEVAAQSAELLQPGGKYVLQLETSTNGLILRGLPDKPDLPLTVATTILRDGPRPPALGDALKPLLAELESLPATQTESVRAALRAILPNGVPDAESLKSLVDDGGLHYEAKLARQTEGGPASQTTDLKRALLQMLHDMRGAGEAALPAARAVLDGIEALQAVNVLAQTTGSPYSLQIPFPDGDEWRTAHLSLEPERDGREADGRPTGFRLLMHVPLAKLGDTWIDAGLSGDRFRAALYIESAAARDRIRADLPALRDELQADGFSEVLLDVRPAAELPERRRQRGAAMRAGLPESVSILDVRA